MSAGAFESGRSRLLTRHRWVKARGIARVLWFVALAALPIAFAASGVYYLDLQVYRTGGRVAARGSALRRLPSRAGRPAVAVHLPADRRGALEPVISTFLFGQINLVLMALVVFLVQPFMYLPSTGDKEMTWTWWQHIYGDAYTWVAIGLLVVLATRSRIRTKISSA